ncbi:MAG: hypothetical protein WC373_12555 [Smithella sp.]|jgi:hypothetical protein
MEPTFKMLRKEGDGRILPYSDALAANPNFTVIEMTKQQILSGQKATLQGSEGKRKSLNDVRTKKSDKPGVGWVKNKNGTWQRKTKNVKRLSNSVE